MAELTDFRDPLRIGSFSNYYFPDESGKKQIFSSLDKVIKGYSGTLELNPASISSMLNRFFMLGDQTLLQNIYRAPWLSRISHGNEKWVLSEAPRHGNIIQSPDKVADELTLFLKEEAISSIGSSKKIGILLSGGMDSRVVAAIVNDLINKGVLAVENVVAYTWGVENSRDVQYSQRICKAFDWQFRHFPVTVERFRKNIAIASERGCEYSAFHLHAMPDIAEQAHGEVEIILAASYGDSIGRAEFSGKHLKDITDISQRWRNKSLWFEHHEYSQIKLEVNEEVRRFRNRFPEKSKLQIREMEKQAHYMRRMLNPCMEVINDKVPVYQMFTSAAVVELMWGLAPEVRNDLVYLHLLKRLNPFLYRIPWARTGCVYGESEGTPDEFLKKHHSYEYFVQEILMDELIDFIFQSRGRLPFRFGNADRLAQLIRRFKGHNFDYLENLLFIVSLGMFLKEYEVEVAPGEKSLFQSQFLSIEYLLLRSLRKFRS